MEIEGEIIVPMVIRGGGGGRGRGCHNKRRDLARDAVGLKAG